jgi:hypothetical protein
MIFVVSAGNDVGNSYLSVQVLNVRNYSKNPVDLFIGSLYYKLLEECSFLLESILAVANLIHLESQI